MDEIRIFHEAAFVPQAVAERIRAGSGLIIGYPCSYVPAELIHAAGFHPMRLFSSGPDIELAENHLQAYCCSQVRGILEDSLSGRLDFLHGTVFAHTCDSMQRLSDIWRLQGTYTFFADMVLPVKLDTPAAMAYMLSVVKTFKADLERLAGKKITDSALAGSIRLYNRLRSLLSALYKIKSQNPWALTGADLYAVVRGAMIMDTETAAGLLESIVSALEQNVPAEPAVSKRLVVSGAVCDSRGVYDIIESAGAVVAGDDLCTGQRWFDHSVDETIDPVTAIADRLVHRMPCPAKHAGLSARAENLARLAEENKASGVLFLLLKFCDPHAFDYPYLAGFLEKRGIKSLLLEMDGQQESTGQLATRIETFVQMI